MQLSLTSQERLFAQHGLVYFKGLDKKRVVQLILFFLVNYSSQSLTRRIFVTREELGLLTTLLFVILRRESSESQICDCNKESSLKIPQFCSLQAPFLVQEQIIKKSISFAYLRNLAKTKFLYPMNSVDSVRPCRNACSFEIISAFI